MQPTILDHLDGVRKSGAGWVAKCKAHEDRRASLSISIGDDGRTLVKCHAGCTAEAIVAACGLTMRDLAPPDDKHSGNGSPTISMAYDYRDESGTLLYQSLRMVPKDFRQRKPKPGGGWQWSLNGCRRVPYRLPELLASDPQATTYIVEGERDVETLRKSGLTATTNSGGAGKWLDEFNQHLKDRKVVVLPDNDSPGRKHAHAVASGLLGIAAEINVVELPGLAEHGDVSDWLDAGNTIDDLKRLVDQAPHFDPTAIVETDAKVEAALDEIDEPLRPPPERPLLDDDALYGIAGEIVRSIEPESESDPAGVLISLLVSLGNMLGRSPYFVVEGTTHHTNLFAVLVGSTARGRKGTTDGRVRSLLSLVDPDWSSERIQTGLVSGEGLIWGVRDPIFKREPVKDKGKVVGYEEVEVDPGVSDKRLLVVESEFASVLRACKRETNTLSPTVRSAWDSGSLRTLAKQSPAKSTNAHISVIGHITGEELRRALAEVEAFSGFANRFLWVSVARSKLLPDGGRDIDLTSYAQRLSDAKRIAGTIQRMRRDKAAAALWRDIYVELATGASGLLGAVTSRGEAIVLRLSMILALLDESDLIVVDHLKAAKAVWDYCRQSAALIFGDSTGSSIGDKLLDLIRTTPGVSRRDMLRALGNNVKAAAIVEALAEIRDQGQAEPRRETTGGRPAEKWFPASTKVRTNEQREQSPPVDSSLVRSFVSDQQQSEGLSSLVRNTVDLEEVRI